MEIQLRPFSVAEHYAYQGVEGAAEYAEMEMPLEGKTMLCEIVVDDNGINLLYRDGEDMHDFSFELVAGMGVSMAKHLLTLVDLTVPSVTIEDLMVLGFAYNHIDGRV